GGHPSLHADAWRREAELEGRHLGHARRLPQPSGDARRVHGADQGRARVADLMDSLALADRVAIVTGAGRGIGRAVAEALARPGAAVGLAARTRAEVATVAGAIRDAGGRALAVPTDVTQDARVEALVDETVGELGRVDILVTAAGVAAFGPVSGAKTTDWD